MAAAVTRMMTTTGIVIEIEAKEPPMSRLHTHAERHAFERIGWLRAAVLGANDGIVSTASLILGVAAAEASRGSVLTAGIAALVGGAMSMAAGEYVSVSSQADTEKADMEREKRELAETPEAELMELKGIYMQRGLEPDLALEVAKAAPQGSNILAMLPDTGERYLSTPLFANIPAEMTDEELSIVRSTPSAQPVPAA